MNNMSDKNNALMEPINENRQKGIEELAELLTFLPEEMRVPIVEKMIAGFLAL